MFIKYPKTEHLLGSKFLDVGGFSPNFCDNEQIPFSQLTNTIVIEEKMDGIGIGIGFHNGSPYLQQRGHIYSFHETEFPHALLDLKIWLLSHEELFYELLGEQYVIFGEWLQYKHTVFYDSLPCYFLEYDIYNNITNSFLSTAARQKLLHNYKNIIHSVPVLEITTSLSLEKINNLFHKFPKSTYKTLQWEQNLKKNCLINHIDFEITLNQTLNDQLYEGFYIKTENDNNVIGRYKWIRKNFMNILLNGTHWKTHVPVNNIIIP
jgi:hypothetical protein